MSLAPLAESGSGAAAPSPSRQIVEAQFRTWLTVELWPDARQVGLSKETFDRLLERVALDWTLPELQPPGSPAALAEQRQAEFLSPGRYFAGPQLARLARDGRALLAQWSPTLDRIERRYGVPREIVVAIWGRESNYGKLRPTRDAITVLSTQAFMGRRKPLYHRELLAALQAVRDGLSVSEMKVSWAGAMGQPQFLPSMYLKHAVDFDEDGRRDIWQSVPDSLASIANYLVGHGWRADRHWGLKATLTAAVSCALEGPLQGKPVREWQALGVAPAGGGPWPVDPDQRRFLLMPAGRLGPAYLVSDNFHVLKRYNESDLYALFIGHLADRLRADLPVPGPWTEVSGFTREDVRQMQLRLQAQGYDVGQPDGLIGFATRTAIGRWQARQGREETCFPTADLIRGLR